MSIRGPEALASLDEAMRDIRREEDDISSRIARASERLAKVKEGEAELFRQLAQLRLDPSVQGELDGAISAAERSARDMLKAHTKSLNSAEEDVASRDAALARLSEERAAALKTFETHQSELKTLAGRLGATIAKEPVFAAKRNEARELAEIAAQAMRKTEQAEADREEKGRPYRDDPLFTYLWEAGYGTANYRANNLVRYFDGLVAQLIGFSRARPNFAMLNEIPLRLREHAERQVEIAQRTEAELDALELQAIDSAGGKPIRDAMEAAQQQIEALDSQILAAEDLRDESAKALAELSHGGNPSFEAALESQTIPELRALAAIHVVESSMDLLTEGVVMQALRELDLDLARLKAA